jgi:hypothetical protein
LFWKGEEKSDAKHKSSVCCGCERRVITENKKKKESRFVK